MSWPLQQFLRKLKRCGLYKMVVAYAAIALVITISIACGDAHAPNTSYTLAQPIEDVSFGDIRRARARIFIPVGRSREEVRATLKRAAEEIARRNQQDALMVFGYRPEDEPTGHFTVGRAALAPNGRWDDAGSTGPVEVEVSLGSPGFAEPPPDVGKPSR